MPVGSVEIALPAGGDFSQTPNGDLALVQDTATGTAATTQRIIRMILSNARVLLASGQYSMPDDKVNSTFGSNARASVGQPLTSSLRGQLQAQIFDGLASMAEVASVPAPSVNVTAAPQFGLYAVLVNVQCQTVTGEIVTIPSLSLTLGA